MQTNLRDRIHNRFSRFVMNLVPLARRMNLVKVLPVLETLAQKAGSPGSNRAPLEGPRYILGCSPTAAGDITKTGERSDFPNLYPGSMPPDGSWGTYTDDMGDTYQIHPVIATSELMQKRWHYYQSTAPDPDPGWEPVEPVLGGYMHSSQSSDGDTDGDTEFYTNSSAAPN